jgi:hypothetical protein
LSDVIGRPPFIINHKSLMSSSSGAHQLIIPQMRITTTENLEFENVETG